MSNSQFVTSVTQDTPRTPLHSTQNQLIQANLHRPPSFMFPFASRLESLAVMRFDSLDPSWEVVCSLHQSQALHLSFAVYPLLSFRSALGFKSTYT